MLEVEKVDGAAILDFNIDSFVACKIKRGPATKLAKQIAYLKPQTPDTFDKSHANTDANTLAQTIHTGSQFIQNFVTNWFGEMGKSDNPLPPSDLHEDINVLIDRNRKWAAGITNNDPNYFLNLAKGQHPKILFIGCSDSRVPAETMTGCAPGELFVHRNIANLVVNGDTNGLSVIQYAVEILSVNHIIICGHYGCGGIKAAITPHDLGLMENWLRNIRDVYRLHDEELKLLSGEEVEGTSAKHNRLVELNIAEQCMNVYKLGFVQRSRLKSGYPKITGLVYDIQDGLLKILPLDLKEFRNSLQHVYKLYSD